MNQDRLSELIEQPRIQKRILGKYKGGYSLGLMANDGKLAIRVRIQGEDTDVIPRQVTLEGATIPIEVSPNFELPKPLPGSVVVGACSTRSIILLPQHW